MLKLGLRAQTPSVLRPLGGNKRCLSSRASAILSSLDIPTSGKAELPGVFNGTWGGSGEPLKSVCPSTGETLAYVATVCVSIPGVYGVNSAMLIVPQATPGELAQTIELSREAYLQLRIIPGPRRGEILRQIREALAAKVSAHATKLDHVVLGSTTPAG